MHEILLTLTAVAYLAAMLLLYFSIQNSSGTLRSSSILAACLGVVSHFAAQYHHWFSPGSEGVNIFNILSLCALVVVLLLVVSLEADTVARFDQFLKECGN